MVVVLSLSCHFVSVSTCLSLSKQGQNQTARNNVLPTAVSSTIGQSGLRTLPTTKSFLVPRLFFVCLCYCIFYLLFFFFSFSSFFLITKHRPHFSSHSSQQQQQKKMTSGTVITASCRSLELSMPFSQGSRYPFPLHPPPPPHTHTHTHDDVPPPSLPFPPFLYPTTRHAYFMANCNHTKTKRIAFCFVFVIHFFISD